MKLLSHGIRSRLVLVLLLAVLIIQGINLGVWLNKDKTDITAATEKSLSSATQLFIHLANLYQQSEITNKDHRQFIQQLKQLTDSEFTFLQPAQMIMPAATQQGSPLDPQAHKILKGVVDVTNSTLPEGLSHQLRDRVKQMGVDELNTQFTLHLGNRLYLTELIRLNVAEDQSIIVLIQQPMTSQIAKNRSTIVLLIAGVTLIGLTLIGLIGYLLGRNIIYPVNRLIGAAQAVQQGGQHWVGMAYLSKSLSLERKDELGRLALAFNQMVRVLQEKEQMQNLLGKVVSPEIADQLLQHEIKLGGEERQVTVLFLDIRNFTGISEGQSPERVLKMLNTCLSELSQTIDNHHGVVDKYIGDSIMALFGAPLRSKQDATNAISAALAIESSLAPLNTRLEKENYQPIKVGTGISTGTVVAGNMGSKSRLNYSVIGDNVNIASRLEGLTKQYGVWIIVNESTKTIASEFAYRWIDRVRVRGRRQTINIYQPLCHRDNLNQATRTLIQTHQSAMEAYIKMQWVEAISFFEKAHSLDPDTPLYPFFIARCRTFIEHPPESSWDGTVDINQNSEPDIEKSDVD